MQIKIYSNKRGFYLKINQMELADFYNTLGLNTTGGRVYFQSKEMANQQVVAERDWAGNKNRNPYRHGHTERAT